MKHYANALWGIALLTISMLWLTTALALAPAGYEIKNKATVTYQDSLGNEYTAISNEAVVTVAEVYNAMLDSDRTTAAAAGQTVYFSHQLTNNGNADDRFTLSAADVASSSSHLSDLKVYQDINGDGQPSSGEPEVTGSDEVAVAAGTSINLVVAASIPAGATTTDTLALTLTAVPKGRMTSASSRDGTLTNTDTITITEGAVLQVSKEVIKHEPPTAASATGTVTYRLQIKNNGADLAEGGIYDFFPDFVDVDALDGKPTTDGRLGNMVVAITSDLKAELPMITDWIDSNNNTSGLYVAITGLKGGASASLEFSVTYNATDGSTPKFEAGTLMKDKAWVGYGVRTGVGGIRGEGYWELVSESNLTEVKLPQTYKVSANNKANEDGKDETLASASAGGFADFINTITNLGNGQDIFNLTVTSNTFPTDTEFSLWDETGTIPLSDSDGDGIVDTGVLNSQLEKPGDQIKIMVRAKLPANAPAGVKTYEAVLTAVSIFDAGATDSVTNVLSEISPASVDLANYKYSSDRNDFHGQVTAISDFFKEGAEDDYDPVEMVSSTLTRKAGEKAEFGLYIANRSAVSDSFGLDATVNMADSAVRATKTRWQVTYHHDGIYDKAGKVLSPATGAVITSTPLLPAETVMQVIAILELVGSPGSMEAGDYYVQFTATPRGSAISNSTLNKLVLTSEYVLAFRPDAEGQVEAGSFIEYQHTLSNNGNTTLDVAILPSTGSTIPAGWSYVVKKADGTVIATDDSVADYLDLAAGAEEKVTVRITAEATLPPGSEFILTLEAQGMVSGNPDVVTTASLTETTRVLSPSEARISSNKTVATVADAGGYGTFEEVLSTKVEPGKRVVWKVVATNTSVGVAENVIIHESAPAFTQLAPTADTGATIAGNPMIGGIAADPKQVTVDGNKITFFVGDGADNTSTGQKGGTLGAGAFVETTFEVVIEK